MQFMRLIIIYLSLCCLFSLRIVAQAPGAVSPGNTLWLRSDAGISQTAGTVSQWNDLSGANVTGNFTVQALAGTANPQSGPGLVDAGVNFNPYIRFNGSNNSLSSQNIFPGTSLVTNSNMTAFQVVNVKGGIVWFKWETDQLGSTARLGFENAAGRIRFDFPKAVPATAGQNIGVTNVLNTHALSTCYADVATSVNRLNGANDNVINIPAPGNFAAISDKLVIGNENLLNLPAQVDLAEVVIYARTLNASEINLVESYLAVKYGFTLNQAAANGNDYRATDGTITWNRAANAGYAANITGIGRDDATSLHQRQSRSVNTAGLVTIYNGTYPGGVFPSTNALNTNNFAADRHFVLFGDNAASTAMDQCIYNGKGKRMQRTWKVSVTGAVSPVTLAVDQASVPSSVRNLLVSSDPAFPPGSTTLYPLTSANGKLFRDLSLNNNEYFTFSTDTIVLSFAVTEPVCTSQNSGSVNTTITGLSEVAQYSWNPSGQTTPNLANAGPGIYTLTITQGTCQYSQQVTLNAPALPAAPAVRDTSICRGGSATLSVQSPVAGVTYEWYDAATGGNLLGSGTSYSTAANLTSDMFYYVEAVNGVCRSTRTLVRVIITLISDAIITNATVCNGSTATLNVTNAIAGYVYQWYDQPTGGTLLGTGTSFTSPALTVPTTFYALAVSGVCPGNRVPEMVDVITVASPSAQGTSVCSGTSASLSVSGIVVGNTYSWYTVPTGGTPVFTGITFNTPVINAAQVYYVEASDGQCASVRTSVAVGLISPLDSPRVTATFISSSSITFSWTAVAGALGYQVSVDDGPFVPAGTGPGTTTYTINGLNNSQTVSVRVIALGPPERCGNGLPGYAAATTFGQGFFMPTAFTPNGDNLNDILKPYIPGGSVMEDFRIYNRWGQVVFSTDISGEGWDGRFKGAQQPSGTYVWMCRYRYGGNLITEKGMVTLFY